MIKEQYIQYVREYKIKLHALVRLQRYFKRYLRKSKYPDKNFLLTEKDIKDILTTHLPNWATNSYSGRDLTVLYLPSERDAGNQYMVERLRGILHQMQVERVTRKEEFKESQINEKVA